MDLRLLIESIVLILSVILAAYLAVRWQKNARIRAYTTEPGHIKRKNGEIISTHNLILRNDGKKEAKNLQVIHLNLPEDFQVLPAIDYTFKQLKDGTALVFPAIAPGEQITICYAYPGELFGKIHGIIKHDEGLAEYISVLPTKQYSRKTIFFMRLLIVVGAIAILYSFGLLAKYIWF